MVRSEDVYNITLGLLKKDARGQGFGIDEFNLISALVNLELYNSYVSKYEIDATVSDILAPFKVRNATLTLSGGVARFPGAFDRLSGNPTVAHPWGVVTATATVTIVNNPTAKVKLTSPKHGLKTGDIITVTGLSVHTITSQAVNIIDKDNFWVNVDYTGADVLTNAAWTMPKVLSSAIRACNCCHAPPRASPIRSAPHRFGACQPSTSHPRKLIRAQPVVDVAVPVV